jgi:thiosulfate/3-mercaptopyruvate sulfurtransferase
VRFVKSRFGVSTRSVNEPAHRASRWLVSTEWLAARLGDPDVVVVDGSYHLPTAKRDASGEYRAAHIPGAVFFDIEEIADHSSDLPHMLPSAEAFAEAAGSLGISDRSKIVVYDSLGLFSAARVWWTFRVFGAAHVFILDGGLPKWLAEARPVERGEVVREPHKFTARKNEQAVKAVEDVQQALRGGGPQVVDARSPERFRGEGPEPRPSVRPGHMPGSRNVPYAGLVENGRLVSTDHIGAAFAAGGVDLEKPIVTSCGSGVTAAILWLALDALGKEPAGLYDGSWVEWGSRKDLPIATGP